MTSVVVVERLRKGLQTNAEPGDREKAHPESYWLVRTCTLSNNISLELFPTVLPTGHDESQSTTGQIWPADVLISIMSERCPFREREARPYHSTSVSG